MVVSMVVNKKSARLLRLATLDITAFLNLMGTIPLASIKFKKTTTDVIFRCSFFIALRPVKYSNYDR